jgi:hypothetical protein
LGAHTYLIGPSKELRQIEDAFTVIEKKEDIGFTSLLVKRPSDCSDLPPGVKVSQAGLQDIFIAYSMNLDK